MRKRTAVVNAFWDLFVVAALWAILTAGQPLLSGAVESLFHQKPWVHRLLMSAVTLVFFGLCVMRYGRRSAGRPLEESLLEKSLRRLKLTPRGTVWLLFLISAGLGIVGSVVRHRVFHTSFDMAIFTQAVWNTVHGNFLFSSIKGGICLLGDHFSPVLALLALPYALWTDPECLLVIQAVSSAACVFPIFLLAKRQYEHAWIPVLFCAAFVLYLPARNAVRFDFHPEVLAMPLLLWAFDAIETRKLRWASAMLLLSLAVKENAALVTFALGFYGAVFKKYRLFGAGWMAVSALYFFAVIRYVIPYFSGEEYFYLRGNYNAWQETGAASLFRHVFHVSSAAYLIKIFAPLAFLSFLDGPTFMLTLPMLAQNLIARNPMARSIFFQYTALLTPFVFISAIYGGRRILNHKIAIYYFAVMVLLFAGVSEYFVIANYADKATPHMGIVKHELKSIPPDASVRTHEFLASHLAHRKQIHIYENNHPREGGSDKARTADCVVVDRLFLGEREDQALQELTQQGYRIVKSNDGLTVLTR